MGTLRDLTAYNKGFFLAMKIFQVTKEFPSDEKFSMTDQIRRSSRSVCVNLAEGYRKRRYPAHFIAKLTDADMENTETQVWLQFALACDYITTATYNELFALSEEVGRLLNHIQEFPERYGSSKK